MKRAELTLDFFRERSTPDANGCWNWNGSTDGHGYARVKVDGHSTAAHRLAWEVRTGRQVPRELSACHACDNPKCVNPFHIFIGNHKDNAADMLAKGRNPKGYGSRYIVTASKYKYLAPNGRMVSRQRMYQIKKEKARCAGQPIWNPD